jgi:hypothetical protein
MSNKKICTKCKLEKELSEFSFKSKEKGTHQSICKRCRKVIDRERYKANPDSFKERNKAHRKTNLQNNRLKKLEYLSNKSCVDCGESNPIVLDFDHINRKTKEASISDKMSWWSWSRILTEIAKCEIRCANCHRIRTAKQFGWYSNLD